jgi:sugar phosphate isomerase/epimerase
MMTRKEFLKTLAAATAAAYVPEGLAVPTSKMKRGVTLYSYQEEYYTRTMTVEDCIAEAADIGAYGIEMLPECMVPDFPNPSDRWVDQWHGWMDKYGTTPVCYTQFQETKLYKDRELTDAEAVENMVRDFRLAKRLGFKIVRGIAWTPLPHIEKALPYAEEYGIKFAVEIHSPIPLMGERTQQFLEMIDRTKTKHFGFVPDFSLFVKRPPRIERDRKIRDGVLTEKVAQYLAHSYAAGVPFERAKEQAAKMGYQELDNGYGTYLDEVYNRGFFGTAKNDPKDMLKIMPYIFHCHAKFWEMTDDLVEYSIPYEEVLPVLAQGGYDGYLASEYEGQRFTQDAFETDSCEQVRRHHVMMRRMLGEV